MIKFLIRRPIAVLTSFVALLLLGIIAFTKLPISLLPEVDIPAVLIRVDGIDLSAREVEDRLIKPIRSNVQLIKGLKNIETTSSEGYGTVRLEFEHGIDISMAFIAVNEKVDLAMNDIPKDIARPQVIKFLVSDIPVFRLNIYPKAEKDFTSANTELSSFAREIIRRRIEQLPEVAMVDMTGIMQAQVEIIPKLGYLASLGIKEEALFAAFRENSYNLGSILVKDGHYRYFMRFSSAFQNLDALRKIPLYINGRLLKLSEIADVKLTNTLGAGFYQYNGLQSVNFAIIKQASARMEDLKVGFKQLVKRMERDYPELSFKVSQDQTALLDYAISNLKQDLLLGGLLSFFLMLLFIRKIRTAILIGVTVPLSLIVSQLGFYVFGISLNIISLGGLILGLSMIIDNSIVVMDTIDDFRRRRFGVGVSAALGTNEIIRPLVTSVLTNCAVFVPLIFLSGLAGALFFDQAISIVIGIVSSLLVAIILLPPLYTLIHQDKGKKRQFEIKVFVSITSLYDRLLRFCFKFPLALNGIILLIIVFGLFAFSQLDKQRLPEITRQDFELGLDWNEYLEPEERSERLGHISKSFQKQAQTITCWSGPQQYLLPIMDNLSYTENRIYIKVKEGEHIDTLKSALSSFVKGHYPLALITFYPAKNAFDEIFSDRTAPLRLIVTNKLDRIMPDLSKVNKIIDTLQSTLDAAEINPVAIYEKINLMVQHDNAARFGISNREMGTQLESLLKNKKIADYQGASAIIPMLMYRQVPKSIFELLNENYILNAAQDRIPLSALITQSYHNEYKYITAGSTGEYYPIDIYTHDPVAEEKKVEELIKVINNMDLALELTGSYFENKALMKEMCLILLVSILLLYFILAAQFESLLQPLFILIELPIAIFGSFILLYFARDSLNLMSMIGIIVMSGLIINDSILKVDAINQFRKKGLPLMDAIFQGGHRRIRSIIMISLTSIGALAPTLFMSDIGSELQKPLAIALIGGMLVGLFISLFFVPLAYWFIYKKKDNND